MKAVSQNYPGILILALLAPICARATSWEWTLTGSHVANGTGTYAGCESSTSTQVTGSYTVPSSGFVVLESPSCANNCTVNGDGTCSSCTSSSTGTCAGIQTDSNGDLYAIQVPNAHLIVQPVLSTETQASYTISAGSSPCPTSTTNSNFVVAQWSAGNDTSSATQTGYGTIQWSDPNLTVTGLYDLVDNTNFLSNISLDSASCAASSGQVNITGSGDHGGTLTFNSIGEFSYVTNADHRFFGVIQPTLSNSQFSAQLLGLYAGFYWTSDGSPVMPVTNMLITSAASSVAGNVQGQPSETLTFQITNVNSPVN